MEVSSTASDLGDISSGSGTMLGDMSGTIVWVAVALALGTTRHPHVGTEGKDLDVGDDVSRNESGVCGRGGEQQWWTGTKIAKKACWE